MLVIFLDTGGVNCKEFTALNASHNNDGGSKRGFVELGCIIRDRGALPCRPICFPVAKEKGSWTVWLILLLLISCGQ